MADVGFLDALFPPANPRQLVADLVAAQASACGIYVLRRDAGGINLGIGGWTAAHVEALLEDGFGILPIMVPGSSPLDTDPGTAMATAEALGCPVGPMSIDLEKFSTPNAGWVEGCIAELRANGWRALRYGDVSLLASYPPGDGDWISHGYIPVSSGALFPRPELPVEPGVVGDQYAVQVTHAGQTLLGAEYDGSVFSSDVFTGEGDHSMNAGLATGLANVAIKAVYGRGPTTQELVDFAGSINGDGSNYGDLVQGLYGNLGNPDVSRLQNTKLADEVAALQAGQPPAPPVPGHTHSITTSGTTGGAIPS
jgi:hypothetical protein